MNESAKTVSLYLYPETDKGLAARGDNRSQIIARDLDRLYTLYHRAMREVQFTEAEVHLIVDSLNGTIMDADSAPLLWASIEDSINLDGLAEKWNVDGPGLVKRLKALNALQAMAMADAAERVWATVDSGGDFDAAVKEIFNIKE